MVCIGKAIKKCFIRGGEDGELKQIDGCGDLSGGEEEKKRGYLEICFCFFVVKRLIEWIFPFLLRRKNSKLFLLKACASC